MNTKATAEARVGQLAEQQAGCVARAQALELGVSDDMIRYRLRTQRWRRAHPGVYILGGVPRCWMQEVWAAVLAVGADGVVTHETALLLHGIRDTQLPKRPITLTVPHGKHHRIEGAVIHQISDLRRDHERDAEASRAGWVTLRFLYEQIVATPKDVAATVADVRRARLEQLGAKAKAA